MASAGDAATTVASRRPAGRRTGLLTVVVLCRAAFALVFALALAPFFFARAFAAAFDLFTVAFAGVARLGLTATGLGAAFVGPTTGMILPGRRRVAAVRVAVATGGRTRSRFIAAVIGSFGAGASRTAALAGSCFAGALGVDDLHPATRTSTDTRRQAKRME